ncbi:gamma-glutamylcyclotransferase family protein [Cryptobacterium curtum]|uniref:gamma-glutamylcyclotransferase family protein n=1 Tax=Cryptobacterium curtum TaxID=84163 RepID=UPI0028D61DBB|nr:gamma-glutamylcyclotransferase family protein [Cryptobacterium curtum]
MPELYFAYGSNLDFGQMEQRCPGAEYLGVATLHNHALRMDAAGFATVVNRRGEHVQGALWDLTHANENKMDGFEGVEDGFYRKQFIGVTYEGDRRPGKSSSENLSHAYAHGQHEAASVLLDALIYLSARPPFIGATWRSDYLDRICRGAVQLHLDRATISQLANMKLVSRADHSQVLAQARGLLKTSTPVQ